MTKKELEKKVTELEDLVNHQKRLIDILYIHVPDGVQISCSPSSCSPNIDDICPIDGGYHDYKHSTGGWTCRCGKLLPFYSRTT